MKEKIICLVRWLLWLPVHVTCWLSCSVLWLLRHSRQLSENFRVTSTASNGSGPRFTEDPQVCGAFLPGALAHGEICCWRKANMIIGYVRTCSLVRRVMRHCLFKYIRLRSFSNLYRTLPKLVLSNLKSIVSLSPSIFTLSVSIYLSILLSLFLSLSLSLFPWILISLSCLSLEDIHLSHVWICMLHL